jgi:hypothetical protein
VCTHVIMSIPGILRWCGRLSSVVVIVILALIVVGERSAAPSSMELVGLAFFPGLVCIGLVLSWWREWMGAAVATFGLVGFYLWSLIARGHFTNGPWFILFWSPALFFFASWLTRRRSAGSDGPTLGD